MDVEGASSSLLAPSPEYLATVKVFPVIVHIKSDITENIDTAFTWEQLTAADTNFAIIRPLVFKYASLKNLSTVYAFLVVRSHFLSLADSEIAHSTLMAARAMACEVLATKILRHFASSPIELAAVLTTSWSPIAGAPEEVVGEVRNMLGRDEEDIEDPTSALEMAIATKAKTFLASSLVQTIVNHIYSGRIVFSTASNRSLLADNYKPRAIEIYDTRNAPFLDHYRLRVPRYGAVLELLNFILLFATFVLCLSNQTVDYIGTWEAVFIVFAVAFALEEYTAAREHGWSIYIASMWNVFDASFIAIFLVYFVLRMKGLNNNDPWASEMAFDILACGACILFPRLAFFAIKHNVVILALRGMIGEFVFFMTIAAVCFSGLLFTLWFLASGTWTIQKIAWLMVQIWFGNTYLSFAQAESFHPIFGPILMTGFAALSNTLLLTILISILSNTFARIDANATQEYLFQFTITTIEGVKSDALFSYQPPFNLIAYILLLPLTYTLTPRGLHSANVFLIKLTSFPILIIIGIYERYLASGQNLREKTRGHARSVFNSIPRNLKNMPILEALMGSSSQDIYDAIFDVDLVPDDELFGQSDDEREGDIPALRSLRSMESFRRNRRMRPASSSARRSGGGISTSPSPRRRPKDSLPSPTVEPPSPTSPIRPPIGSINRERTISLGQPNPLSKLFSPKRSEPVVQTVFSEETLAGIKRMENVLEGLRDLPVQRLKEEMKELQERQSRIENLLMTLTRGMRNESGSLPKLSRS